MRHTTRILISAVALLHVGFFVAEFFFWETLAPVAKLYEPQSAFRADPETARLAVSLGRNIGFYNGLIGGTLVCLLLSSNVDSAATRTIATFLLAGVFAAGVLGGFLLLRSIPLFQSVPAALALADLWRPERRKANAGAR